MNWLDEIATPEGLAAARARQHRNEVERTRAQLRDVCEHIQRFLRLVYLSKVAIVGNESHYGSSDVGLYCNVCDSRGEQISMDLDTRKESVLPDLFGKA